MPPVFWIGIGLAAVFVVVGAVAGARARTASFGTGLTLGLVFGVMANFPLIAIGLATS
ncbi:MAG: hypothetical protein R2725_05390 [Solirubrobacterales bacterium]